MEDSKKELIKKWEESGLLNGVKPMSDDNPLINMLRSNPVVKIMEDIHLNNIRIENNKNGRSKI